MLHGCHQPDLDLCSIVSRHVNACYCGGMMRPLLLSALIVLASLSQSAEAADIYPNRPIRLLVGFTPGGAADVSARVISRKMSESLGVNIVVENRPGAGGNIA